MSGRVSDGWGNRMESWMQLSIEDNARILVLMKLFYNATVSLILAVIVLEFYRM